MTESSTHKYKVLLLGDGAVGKTSLIRRYVDEKFSSRYSTTMGMEPYYKEEIFNNIIVGLSVWDVAGQERFRNMRQMFYKGSMGIILVCDLTRKETLEHLITWKEEVVKYTESEIPIVVVANKSDLIDQREFDEETGRRFSQDLKNCNGYYETSALTGDKVRDMFHFLANEIMNFAQY